LFTHSCVYNITGLPSGGVNVITEDPQIVDIANANYNLGPDSPCINTGTLI